MKKTLLSITFVELLIFGTIIIVPSFRYYFWGDETRQVIPLTLSLWQDIRSGSFGFYNWKMSFGATNAIHFLSYLGSPSFWLMCLLPSKEAVISFLPISACMDFLLTGVFSYLWLSHLFKDETARFTGSLIFTFSGWAMFQLHYYSYLDAWLYIAILLYSLEELLQHRKQWLFAFIVALLTILDLFTMYMASWLILFYLLVRLEMIYPEQKFFARLKNLRIPFLLYLLGLGLAGVVFFQDLAVLFSSSRVNTGIGSYFTDLSYSHVTLSGLFRNIASFFSPVINDYDYVIYSSPFKESSIHSYALFSYSFILFPLLLPQLKILSLHIRKPLLKILIILGICSLCPWIYVLFNGNNASRWCFYIIVFNVMLLGYVMEYRKFMDLTLLKKSCFGVIGILCLLSGLALGFSLTSDTNTLSILEIVPCLVLLILVYSYALTKDKTRLFHMAIVAEVILCLTVRIVNGKTLTIGHGERAQNYEQDLLDTHITDAIQEEDSTFYRISSDESTAENYLLPMVKNYKSNSFYFSVYNSASANYYQNRITGDWFIPYAPSKFLSYTMLGNKYLVTYEETSFVPHGYEEIEQETIRQDGEEKTVKVYRNTAFVQLGYATSTTYNLERSYSLDTSLQDFAMTQGILDDESNGIFVEDKRFVCLAEDAQNAYIDVDIQEPGTLFIDYSQSQPSSKGSLELYKDGNVFTYQEFDEYGFYAVHIDEDVDGIGVYAESSYYEGDYTNVNVYFISDADLDEVYAQIQSYDTFDSVEEEPNGNLKAHITIHGEGKTVATSIPYNEGWKVYVNGEEISYKEVNTAFIGFDLPEGDYNITFKFVPQGFTLGCTISAISLGIALFLILYGQYKNKRKYYNSCGR